jgi:hypothetical protein
MQPLTGEMNLMRCPAGFCLTSAEGGRAAHADLIIEDETAALIQFSNDNPA